MDDVPGLDDFFIQTNFYDLLPLARHIATGMGFGDGEMIEAVCRVYDKYMQYPPTLNRRAWFETVFAEKLLEAQGDILSFRIRNGF